MAEESVRQIGKSPFAEYKGAFGAYEAGKARRYQLLFAVNGGALAIANVAPAAWRNVLLGFLMPYFAVIMVKDIHTFGERFRSYDLGFCRDAGEHLLRHIRFVPLVAWFGLVATALMLAFGMVPGTGAVSVR
jgi:hypothetical protein